MSSTLAEITYYLTLLLGYGWAVILVIAGQPFDALVLFWVTLSFNTYRNAIQKELS